MADKKKTLDKIYTGKWQRQWALTKAGVQASGTAAGKMCGNVFLAKEKRQQRNKQVLSEQAQFLAQELGKLKGSVVKIGQMMALYGEHVLPQEVTEAMRSLEENTQSLSWKSIEPVIKEQLGHYYEEFDIEQDAIGAASLAQVHKAWHKPSEKFLCLKVQYPGVKDAIDSDLDAVLRLLRVSRLVRFNDRLEDWVAEIRHLLHREVDYLLEARMTQGFADKLKNNRRFVVPSIYSAMCTESLLVESFEEGFPVTDERVKAISLKRRNTLAKDFLELFFREVFEWKTLQTDPNFGNYRVQLDEQGKDKIVLLDFGAVIEYDDSFIKPVTTMIKGAILGDSAMVRSGSVALDMMQESYPDDVHSDFSELCFLLVEPFVFKEQGLTSTGSPYVNESGGYRWAHSYLPRRAAKHAAKSALSKYFAVPPKEFTLLTRKLLGVYSFISALDAEFSADDLVKRYI